MTNKDIIRTELDGINAIITAILEKDLDQVMNELCVKVVEFGENIRELSLRCTVSIEDSQAKVVSTLPLPPSQIQQPSEKQQKQHEQQTSDPIIVDAVQQVIDQDNCSTVADGDERITRALIAIQCSFRRYCARRKLASLRHSKIQDARKFFNSSRIDVMMYLKRELVSLFVRNRKDRQYPISEFDISYDVPNSQDVASSVMFTISNNRKTLSALGLPVAKKELKEKSEAMDGLGGCLSFFEEKDEEYAHDADVATSSGYHPSELEREAVIGVKSLEVRHEISSKGSDGHNIESIAGKC